MTVDRSSPAFRAPSLGRFNGRSVDGGGGASLALSSCDGTATVTTPAGGASPRWPGPPHSQRFRRALRSLSRMTSKATNRVSSTP